MLCSLNELKKDFIETGKCIYKNGFSPGASGNISFRIENKIFITASGCCLGKLSESDIAVIDMEAKQLDTGCQPSSEKYMHTEIYKKRPEINCIIHAHPPKSTALSVAGEDLKTPLIAEAVVTIGEIPLVKYDTPSTFELAADIARHFIKHDAVLMANHGVTVCGSGFEDSLYKLETIEFLSEIRIITSMLNKANPIPDEKLPALLSLKAKNKQNH